MKKSLLFPTFPITAQDAIDRVLQTIRQHEQHDNVMNAQELIQLGSVWIVLARTNTTSQKLGKQLFRLLDSQLLLNDGDYIRIHQNPRRFTSVYNYCWDGMYNTIDPITNRLGVIIARNDTIGYIVLNKPEKIPVHMTVDNCRENVAACIYDAAVAKAKVPNGVLSAPSTSSSSLLNHHDENDIIYVSTPQRLDQNTSGLFVVATSKHFAKYYAALLRSKTAKLLSLSSSTTSSSSSNNDNNDNNTNSTSNDDFGNVVPTKTTTTPPTVTTDVVGGIYKLYRCLVCIIPPVTKIDDNTNTTNWSIERAADMIRSYVDSAKVMRHYLEPSVRSPKRFVEDIPQDVKDRMVSNMDPSGTTSSSSSKGNLEAQWQESLLRITKASPIYPLVGTDAASNLAQTLWTSDDGVIGIKPTQCQAVMELEIELLTGRTHQIRGQLSAFGYPLVGDTQYGGSGIYQTITNDNVSNSIIQDDDDNDDDVVNLLEAAEPTSDRLALQCCKLVFVDPDMVHETPPPRKKNKRKRSQSYVYRVDDDVETTYVPSQRWNEFHLDDAWWTSALRLYEVQSQSLSETEQTTVQSVTSTIPLTKSTTTMVDSSSFDNSNNNNNKKPAINDTKQTTKSKKPRPDLLPDRVQLSPGKNKYILARATHPDDDTVHWFVKSASPKECGGPYHGNVAQDLREWIQAVGYDVTVTGGGRIDYRPNEQLAIVYGFSYGFGKGDHQRAASIITTWTNGTVVAKYDNSEGLY